MSKAIHFDAIILGAGAAGLMCAIEAGRRGRRVAVLEHSDGPGKKILISGGGRCNFTNLHCAPENFLSSNPHFAKSALARYTSADFIALVEKHKIPYHEKKLGQLFCDGSAHDILAMLLAECAAAGAEIVVNSKIHEIGHAGEFSVRTNHAEYRAPALVVATGGLSIPKMGATAFGYELARQFGIRVRDPWPGLVPVVFHSEDHKRFGDLAGISAEVVAECNEAGFREKLLFTHRGLSGPAILQISSYWKSNQAIRVDLAPDKIVTEAFRDSVSTRSAHALRLELRKVLPIRLADRWLDLHPPAAWTNTALTAFERELHQWKVVPGGTEGFEKAEVTAGGVDTDELSAKTMETKRMPGLFFIGEVVDVTGQLGGFNFQWAWASGAATGRAI